MIFSFFKKGEQFQNSKNENNKKEGNVKKEIQKKPDLRKSEKEQESFNVLENLSLDSLFKFLTNKNNDDLVENNLSGKVQKKEQKENKNANESESENLIKEKEERIVNNKVENKDIEIENYLEDKLKNLNKESFDYFFYKNFLTEYKTWVLFADKKLNIEKQYIENLKLALPKFENLTGKETLLRKMIRDNIFEILGIDENLLKTSFYYYKKFKNRYNLQELDFLNAYKALKSDKNGQVKDIVEQAKFLINFYSKKS